MKYFPSPLLLFIFAFAGFSNERPGKPNVVLILTDDLGWQDVKCYDIDEPSPMETPHIDSLAKHGVNFGRLMHPHRPVPPVVVQS